MLIVAFMLGSPAVLLPGAAEEAGAPEGETTADELPAAEPAEPAGADDEPTDEEPTDADETAEDVVPAEDGVAVELELQAARARPPTRVTAASLMDFFTSTSMLFGAGAAWHRPNA